jgi:photosystem II stability/assembly factor-like uncharacterized protein
MNRIRLIITCLFIPMVLFSCNRVESEITPTESLEARVEDQTPFLEPTITPEWMNQTTPMVDTQVPEVEGAIPTSDLTGKWELAVKHMRPEDELVLQHIAMVDVDTGWAIGGPDGRADSILRSVDGGTTWMEVSPPETVDPDNPVIAVGAFLDPDTAWVLYHPLEDPRPGGRQSLKVWYTNNAGDQWRASDPISIEFIGSQRAKAWIQGREEGMVWVLARYGGSGMHKYPVYLLRSEDSGTTWDILEDPYEGLWLQSCPKTGWDWLSSGKGVVTIGYCPFESAEIKITNDAGTNWNAVRLPFPAEEEERLGFTSCEAHSPILFTDSELLVASDCPIWEGDPETIHLLYHTQDFGRTWQIWDYPGGKLLPVGGDVILALGRDLYRSEDQGLTWTLVKTVAWDGQFSFVDARHGWAVATNENEIAFVCTTDGGETWQLIEPVLIP